MATTTSGTTSAALKTAVSLPLLLGLLAGAILLNYVDRGAIAVAGPMLKEDLGLSATQFGVAVSAFFWIYVPMVLLAGWLCDRFCVYRLLAVGVAVWAISTTLTAFVGGLAFLVILRVILGMGESVAFPGSSKIIVRHVPPERRSMANAMMSAAIAVGPAVGTFGGGMIMVTYGWRAMFAFFGILTLLWIIPWLLTVRPLTAMPFGTGRETPYPATRLLRLPALWATSIGHFGSNYGLYFMLSWLPLFLVSARGLSIERMAVLTTSVYLTQAVVSLIWGWVSDHLISRGVTENAVRRGMLAGGHAGMAVCTMGIYMAVGEGQLLLWLILWAVSFSATSPNLYSTSQTFAGARAAGSWIGIQNGVANIAGIIGPVITGVIIDQTGSYMAAFAVASGVTAAAALWYLFALPRIRTVTEE
jgi:MFS family permease